jgi:hemerythrin-like domain-containing protein
MTTQTSELTSAANAFAQDHEALDRSFEAMVTKAQSGEVRDLRSDWSAFEEQLLRHLELEEREVLPAFAREHADVAASLRREHEQIRASLTELGIRLDLHLLRAAAIAGFVAQLREHARREEALFYPWVARHLSASELASLERGLRRAA